MVTEYRADFEHLRATGCLFPLVVRDDPWIIYHGTSSWAEGRIEANGLGWPDGVYTRQDVDRVVKIFRSMNWWGTDSGGIGVLGSFTQLDFRSGEKPIYFHTQSARSATYARRDFAGGETARALRRSILDLERFRDDPKARSAQLMEDVAVATVMVRDNKVPPRVIAVDLAWLRDQLSSLDGLRHRVFEPVDHHRHGVVYAVRIPKDRRNHFYYDPNSGTAAYGRVDPSCLIAKIRLSGQQCEAADEWRTAQGSYHMQKDDILREVLKSSSAAPGTRGPLSASTLEGMDPAAGVDLAPEIVQRFGSDQLKRTMELNPTLRS